MYNFIFFMVCAIFVFNCSLIIGLFIIFKLWGYRARTLTLKHTCLASCHKQLNAHNFADIQETTTTQLLTKKDAINDSENPVTMLTPLLHIKPLSIGHFIARGIYCQKNHKQKDEHA